MFDDSDARWEATQEQFRRRADAFVAPFDEERRALKESVTDAQAQVIEWASRCGRLVSAKEAAEARVKQLEADNAMYKSAIEQHVCKIEELREALRFYAEARDGIGGYVHDNGAIARAALGKEE